MSGHFGGHTRGCWCRRPAETDTARPPSGEHGGLAVVRVPRVGGAEIGGGALSGVEGAEVLTERRPTEVTCLLHDARGLWVCGERRPAVLVPVEDGPHPVLLDRVPVDGRA